MSVIVSIPTYLDDAYDGGISHTIAPVLCPAILASALVWSSRHPENMVTIFCSDPYCPANSPVRDFRQQLWFEMIRQ